MSDTSLLSQAELKVTKPRLAVLKALKTQDQPQDAIAIWNGLVESGHSLDQVTVYRILEKLVAAELVRVIDFGEHKKRYELNLDHHHHLVCTQCQRVIALEDCDVNSMAQATASAHGFLITRHSLEFFGLCKSCQSSTH